MRMVGPGGNPSAENLFSVLRAVQASAAVRVRVEVGAVQDDGERAW